MASELTYINHDQLHRCLLLLWMADIPACIIGGVGSGKTTAVEDLCRDLNKSEEFADIGGFHLWKVFLGLVDATEVGGIPYKDGNRIVYAPPSTLPYGTEESGIIFGDEYDRAPPDVQNAFNQILLGREIHGNRISPNAYVVLAMNGDSDRYTTPLSEAARNRVCTLFLSNHAYGNLEQWDEWAKKNGVNDVIRAFAHCRTDLIKRHEEFTELALMTPRSRDMAGRILDASEKAGFKTEDILVPCLNGVIGTGAANELLAFKRMQKDLPRIETMVADPESFKNHDVFIQPDLTYMLSIAVASYAERNRNDAGACIALMRYAPPEIQAWAVKNIVRACPQVATTDEYGKWFRETKEMMT